METRLSPSDSLWLAILEREPAFRSMTAEEVREALKAGEFPARVVEAFLASRAAQRRNKAANR